MGYVLSAYIVDQVKITEALASGDHKLLARIVKSNPDEFDDEEDFPENSTSPPLKTALQVLIDQGGTSSEDSQYRYALEELCRYLGKQTIGDRFDPSVIGLNPQFRRPLPFPIPNPGSSPCLFFLEFDEVVDEIHRADEIDQEELDESYQELLDDWKKTLASAKRKNLGILVTHG